MPEKIFYTKTEVDKMLSDLRAELMNEIEAYKASINNMNENSSEEEGE